VVSEEAFRRQPPSAPARGHGAYARRAVASSPNCAVETKQLSLKTCRLSAVSPLSSQQVVCATPASADPEMVHDATSERSSQPAAASAAATTSDCPSRLMIPPSTRHCRRVPSSEQVTDSGVARRRCAPYLYARNAAGFHALPEVRRRRSRVPAVHYHPPFHDHTQHR